MSNAIRTKKEIRDLVNGLLKQSQKNMRIKLEKILSDRELRTTDLSEGVYSLPKDILQALYEYEVFQYGTNGCSNSVIRKSKARKRLISYKGL